MKTLDEDEARQARITRLPGHDLPNHKENR